jgi:AcrR family transcriptional regulator
MYTHAMAAALSSDKVVGEGTRLVAAHGWDALSLRAVAAALGVTPMALYRHVPDGDALRGDVLDAIVAGAPTVPRTGELGAALSDWARKFHAYLLEFPGVAGRLLEAWFECAPMLERVEDLLALAVARGVEGADAVAVTNAVFTYVLMRGEAERQVRSAGAVRRQLRTARASRPLPNLTALAAHYATAQFGVHFEFGLRALVDGMRLGGQP